MYTVSTAGVIDTFLTGNGNLKTAEYAPDGSYFLLGGDDATVYIFNGTSHNNSLIQSFPTSSGVKDADFSDDSKYIIACTTDGTVYEYSRYCQSVSCMEGYYQDLSSNTCNLCWSTMTGCGVCNSSTACTECAETFLINTATHLC